MPIIRQWQETADGLKTLTQRILTDQHSIEINKTFKLTTVPITDKDVQFITGEMKLDMSATRLFKNGRLIYRVGGVYAVVPARTQPGIWQQQGKPPTEGQRFGLLQDVRVYASGRVGTVYRWNPYRSMTLGLDTVHDYQIAYYLDNDPTGGYESALIWHAADELESVTLNPEKGAEGRRAVEQHVMGGFAPLKIVVTEIRIGRVQQMSDTDVLREGVENRQAYIDLWQRINGKGAWDANPLVARIGYKVWYAPPVTGSNEALQLRQDALDHIVQMHDFKPEKERRLR